jgi:hypothetical protein
MALNADQVIAGQMARVAELEAALAAQQLQNANLMANLAVHHDRPSIKVPVPDTFEGLTSKGERDDVNNWIFQVELYFRGKGITDHDQQVDYAASLLRGSALLWYRMELRRLPGAARPYDTWMEFSAALKTQFVPVNQTRRARDRLAECRQTTAVRRYIDMFSSISLEIDDLDATEQLDRFIRGLKPIVRREVELRAPRTFLEACTIAERVDTIDHSALKDHRFAPGSASPEYGPPSSTSVTPAAASGEHVPMEIDAMRLVNGRGLARTKGSAITNNNSQ